MRYYSQRSQNGALILNPRQEAILAQTGSHGVTEKYTQVSTMDVVNSLRGNGFELKSCTISGTRKSSKEGFQKHMITLGHPDLKLLQVGDSQPEISIVNSHDGLQSFQVFLSVLRLVCSNGLKVPTTIEGFRFRHVGGDLIPRVYDAVSQIKTRMPEVSNWINDLTKTILSRDQQIDFATRAVQLLDLPQSETVSTRVNVRTALRQRRYDDGGDSLWVTYNRVQENMLRGGIRYQTETVQENGSKLVRSNSTREVKAIDTQVRLNAGLADLTKEYQAA